MKNFIIICVAFATFVCWHGETRAQFNSSVFRQNMLANNRGFRNVRSSILNRPSTSPYLALTDLTGNGLDNSSSYFTSVRPRLEFEQSKASQQLAIQQVQRQVSEMRSAAARRSQDGPRATGHPTRFQLYLQYYPGLR